MEWPAGLSPVWTTLPRATCDRPPKLSSCARQLKPRPDWTANTALITTYLAFILATSAVRQRKRAARSPLKAKFDGSNPGAHHTRTRAALGRRDDDCDEVRALHVRERHPRVGRHDDGQVRAVQHAARAGVLGEREAVRDLVLVRPREDRGALLRPDEPNPPSRCP